MPKPPAVTPLEPPACHHLRAATGWFELGNLHEAEAELSHVPQSLHDHPDMLDLRWQMLAHEKKWAECIATASRLTELAPQNILGWIHRSYALHELKRTLEARDNLLPIASQFPNEFLPAYNLACYECQLGNLPQARQWLAKAGKIADQSGVIAMALSDPDLRPLWAEMRNFQRSDETNEG